LKNKQKRPAVPVGASVRVDGVGAVLADLAKIDPEIKKQIRKDAREITKPVIEDAKNRYPSVQKNNPPLRGTAYPWYAKNGPEAGGGPFPFDVRRARRGLRFSVQFNPRVTIIRVRQVDGAAILLESVGKNGNQSGLAKAVAFRYGNRDRFLWASAEKKVPNVRQEIAESMRTMIRNYNYRNR
jgi:hypothetical protein